MKKVEFVVVVYRLYGRDGEKDEEAVGYHRVRRFRTGATASAGRLLDELAEASIAPAVALLIERHVLQVARAELSIPVSNCA